MKVELMEEGRKEGEDQPDRKVDRERWRMG